MNQSPSFIEFFSVATAGYQPYDWQSLVAREGLPEILTVPTGLGKTEVALAWAWRRLLSEADEPSHLVVCLPMRSLVTQTVERLQGYFNRLREAKICDVEVYQLMGGAIDDVWAAKPDQPWVLVGTQDQLLSRALNRGYAMSRFEWPVHFGIVNNDCRWLVDEVQLMGPGLWTTAQLDWMRRKRFPSLKPCLTTWMSATVGTSFLETTDRKRDEIGEPDAEQALFATHLKETLEKDSGLAWWREARRPINWLKPKAKTSAITPRFIAQSVEEQHEPGTLSLVICNTVQMAQEVYEALSADHKVLLTSRFRRVDRAKHEQRLLTFEAERKSDRLPNEDPGLICVSTQVVEAGVDISAHHLFTELAPWPAMLQRLGRMNRKGDDQEAKAWVWETPSKGRVKKGERIGPYEGEDIKRAKNLVNEFAPLSRELPFASAIDSLSVSEKLRKEVDAALQPKPAPLPRALDLHGLFSTERDVHGGFTDVSAFVRGTDPSVDVTVFWRDWEGKQPPKGDELDGPLLDLSTEGCSVAFYKLQKALERNKNAGWVWDEENEHWCRISHREVRPGMLVMLKRDVGCYDANLGWTGGASSKLDKVPPAGRGEALRGDPRTVVGYWSDLESHLNDARAEAEVLCDALSLDGALCEAVVAAAAYHDIGKAHPQWQERLPDRSGLPGRLLAKTPNVVAVEIEQGDDAEVARVVKCLRPSALRLADQPKRRAGKDVTRLRWAIDDKLCYAEIEQLRALDHVLWAGHAGFRPGLRHEVASALAMWWRYRDSETKPYPALAVYLAATHHGKARTVLRSTTKDGGDAFGVRAEPPAIDVNGEDWPLDLSVVGDGAEGYWDEDTFVLTGYGWTGLVSDLLGPWRPDEPCETGVVPSSEPRHLGPFALAYLEALVRIADWRASDQPSVWIKPSEVQHG